MMRLSGFSLRCSAARGSILVLAAIGMLVTTYRDVSAQGYPGQGYQQGYSSPQGAGGNPVCQRLEAQLQSVDRGGNEQVRRYEEAAARQSRELERVTDQARRMGCESSGFFSLFSTQSAQCGPVNGQIQQMRANLDQITVSLERLRGGGNIERDSQRRSVLAALAQNNCGPQYANARPPEGGGFLDSLFGGNSNQSLPPADAGVAPGSFRTVCVRTCDGFYFPISFATTPARFADDEKICKNLCPASEATLFTRGANEDMSRAVSINGQPYSGLPNAFKYRQAFNPQCTCKQQGETWAEALKGIDDRASMEQGDIIVTDERAKQMSQPRQTPSRQPAKGPSQATPPAAAQTPTAQQPAESQTGSDRPVRQVGPTFIQR